MTNGLGDRLPSFATCIEANLEIKYFKCHFRCQENLNVDEQAHLEKSRIEISRNRSKFSNFSYVHRAIFSVHLATLGPVLGHL